ncbi:Ktr system potassium uptake protein B [Mycoplasmopsis californica]|uniref:TrkH family potassium uptake protein n=1 Tax=Mycoplasmopsis equigenitalium TaxID=114883 RepID=A0ABY5J442_9BACT|nr:potassium transporter TrkG [Mycoplasmopsis equigenitalium]UUD36907.1 TrkH family potassium uptake protein [Mycoplasmopsis equigenitalium]VEU69798.1 Ktr system potassium uptake protein B [Mycoplasmopsis californica]
MKNNKFQLLSSRFQNKRSNKKKIKYIFFVYFLIVLIASLILFFPWAHSGNETINYGDALFTSASAFSDTGLITVTTRNAWNMFGQAIIATLIFIGGIGFFALKIFIINYLFKIKTYDFSQRELLNAERGDTTRQTSDLVISSINFIIGTLIIGGISLTLYFYFVPNKPLASLDTSALPESPYHNASLACRFGFFHAISALNNAGFDIMGKHSIAPYYYNFGLHVIFLVLFLIGGIGYPVIYDFIMFVKFRFNKKNKGVHYKWSLISKVSVTTYFIVSLIGFLIVITIEMGGNTKYWKDEALGDKWSKTWVMFFSTFSTRSAGFAVTDMNNFSPATLIIFSILMFIGAAPASTGGGIRTTTFAVVFISLFSKMLGYKSTRMFKRKIVNDRVQMASNIFMISLFLIIIGTLVLHSSLDIYNGKLPDTYSSAHLLFETASAFGTTGLSTGITAMLNLPSKLMLILIMFIGQFGISSTILVWKDRSSKENYYEYIEENIALG